MNSHDSGSSHKARVAVLMGSASDESVMKECIKSLEYFDISYEVRVLSAHRNPKDVTAFAVEAPKRGIEVIIAGAGMAAHLPGAVAAHTILPVIGVPIAGSPLGGQDALYSMVQMPSGVPVATVSIGSVGARNAAILAAEILALYDPELKKKLMAFKEKGSKL